MRRTMRFRLTLVYCALFLATGVLLIALIYLLAAHLPAPAPQAPDLGGPEIPRPETWLDLQREDDLNRLLAGSAIALGVMAVASVVLGWLMAGRVLRPLATMTATVRRISADRLDRRLAAPGPDDELKELADTFDELLGRLESAFVAQRRFVANASHELRTPLTLQQAMVEVALADPEPEVGSMRATFGRLLASCGQQERLIDALLTLARSQQGLAVRHHFDLAAVVAKIVDTRPVTPSLRPAPVFGDPALVERLVTNLLDNAQRYNVPNGWVTISTGQVEGAAGLAGGAMGQAGGATGPVGGATGPVGGAAGPVGAVAGRAILTVSNSGPIVPADRIDDLFEPFRRLGTDRRTSTDGVGLGLSIVAAIAAAHAATITAHPNPEGGLTITVTFPL